MRLLILLSVFYLFFDVRLTAQVGALSGVMTEAETQMAVMGGTVMIEGTTIGAATDLDGNFSLKNVPAGDQILVCTYIGFAKQRVSVNIQANQTAHCKVEMKPEANVTAEVQVVATRGTNSEGAVIMESKMAKQVVSGIGRQQMQKSQDSNAAQAMQRVPGITIMDNRFVMVRGVSERYNSILINNLPAPSTEVDKRTFSFDLLPGSSLDRMMIYKSGSAESPGDFAGGVIKLYTVNEVKDNFTDVNLSLGYRSLTTFREQYHSQGSSTDFLGFDRSFRALPTAFPTRTAMQGSARNAALRAQAAHSLKNNFNPTATVASPDFSVGLALGRKGQWGDRKWSGFNSLHYAQSYQSYARSFNRYFEWVDKSQPILTRFSFTDDTYTHTTRITAMSNWTLEFNPRHRLRWSNLFNQQGEEETIIRTGQDYLQRPNDLLKNYLLGYRSRSIYTGQLELENDFSEQLKFQWVLGGNYLGESEPDLRRFRTYRPKDISDAGYTMQLPPSSNLFETGRYFGNLSEYSFSQGLNVTYRLTSETNSDQRASELKMGYLMDYRHRDFNSRYFSYLYPGFFDPTIGQSLAQLPLDVIFSKENIRTVNGFVLEEGTRPIDAYQAASVLGAAYAGGQFYLGKLAINAGLRLEHAVQQLDAHDELEAVKVNRPTTSWLPFVNLTFDLADEWVLRGGYGRTVNRPEFRELAPFLFYDYKMEAARVGNPNLVTATIDNYDLRVEMYPRMGEVISIGLFYKQFHNPIESRTIITSEQPQFTFINASKAYNYGAELELRKSLGGLFTQSFIQRLSFNVNGAYIFSEVDLGNVSLAQEQVRPLQGQSPFIINAGVYYEDKENGLSVNANYNIIGKRIYSVGDVLFPTIYEMPRHSLDLTISQRFGKLTTLKAGVTNVLNAAYAFKQDSDRNGTINSLDDQVFSHRVGSLVTLSATFHLYPQKK